MYPGFIEQAKAEGNQEAENSPDMPGLFYFTIFPEGVWRI